MCCVEGALEALLKTLVSGSERAADGAAVSLEKLSSHKEVAEEFVSQNRVSIFLKAMDEGGDRVQLPLSRILFYLKAVKPCFLSNLVKCGITHPFLMTTLVTRPITHALTLCVLWQRGRQGSCPSLLARHTSSETAVRCIAHRSVSRRHTYTTSRVQWSNRCFLAFRQAYHHLSLIISRGSTPVFSS